MDNRLAKYNKTKTIKTCIMQINFIDLKNIDKKLYKKCIIKIFSTWLYYNDKKMREQFNLWQINIYPVLHKQDIEQFFTNINETTNPFIPHGNTGMFVINLFINDIKNNMVMLQNMRMASHEIAHAVMAMYYGFEDKKMFVTRVHDVQNASHTKIIKFWYFNRSRFWWKRITLSLLNIEDYVNTFKNKSVFPYYS